MKITDVTIISTNLNRGILNNYPEYQIIESGFNLEDIAKYPKVIFYNVKEDLKNIFSILKEKNILYINVTNDIEKTLDTKDLIIYDKEKIIVEGNRVAVLKKEKLLKRIGLSLPFYVELSLMLKDYDLIDKIYFDKESLKSALWN